MDKINTIPRMRSIKELAAEVGLSYHTIWQWCKSGMIPYVKAGNKYLVNLDRFIDFLNTGASDGGWPE